MAINQNKNTILGEIILLKIIIWIAVLYHVSILILLRGWSANYALIYFSPLEVGQYESDTHFHRPRIC